MNDRVSGRDDSDSDCDSDYLVEEYIKPERIAKPRKDGESEDLLGNFKDIQKEQRIYGTFPKEVFQADFDHDQKLELLDGKRRINVDPTADIIIAFPISAPAKKVRVKSDELKKKIRKKVMAKLGKAKKKKKTLGT